MSLKTSNYGVARTILGIIEYLLWGFLAIGVIIAFTAAGAASRGFGASGLVAAIPGIAISVGCLFTIAFLQGFKAQVDTADYTYQMLGIARDQLAVSKQALAKEKPAQSFAGRTLSGTQGVGSDFGIDGNAADGARILTAAPDPALAKRDWEYRGTQINRTVHGFLVEGQTFETLDLAKQHIDLEARS